MDFNQEKLSGFSVEKFDNEGNLISCEVIDFETWTAKVYDTDGNEIDAYEVEKPTRA